MNISRIWTTHLPSRWPLPADRLSQKDSRPSTVISPSCSRVTVPASPFFPFLVTRSDSTVKVPASRLVSAILPCTSSGIAARKFLPAWVRTVTLPSMTLTGLPSASVLSVGRPLAVKYRNSFRSFVSFTSPLLTVSTLAAFSAPSSVSVMLPCSEVSVTGPPPV